MKAMADASLLRANNITKSYSGVHALEGASFELRAGEVHALIGEKGAGKSTLIKIITGAVEPDSGEIKLNGERITNNSPRVCWEVSCATLICRWRWLLLSHCSSVSLAGA